MKQATTVEEQIELLRSRRMVFKDEEAAKRILLDVGYYRFGFYTFPFEWTYPERDNRNHKLATGTPFESVYELYRFDTAVRRLLSATIDRLEANFKTTLIHQVSNYYKGNPIWYVCAKIMEPSFINKFINKILPKIKNNPILRQDAASHTNQRFPPAWKLLEFATLGAVINVYRGLMDENVKNVIAAKYGCTIRQLINYLRVMLDYRNRCAHGGCVYQYKAPMSYRLGPANIDYGERDKLSGALKIISYMLGTISYFEQKEFDAQVQHILTSERPDLTNCVIKTTTGLQP